MSQQCVCTLAKLKAPSGVIAASFRQFRIREVGFPEMLGDLPSVFKNVAVVKKSVLMQNVRSAINLAGQKSF